MKPETLAMLQNPNNGEPLELIADELVSRPCGERFAIHDGMPDFLKSEFVSGQNLRYQGLYNRIAPLYDLSTDFFAIVKSVSVRARLMEYLDELEIKDGDRVLETSIGTGRNIQLLPKTAHYYGIDISRGMLRQCQRKARRLHWDMELFLCPAERLCFHDEVFDVVYQVGGINYFNDRRAAVNEMVRVAKPGTKLIIVDETEELAKKYEKTPGASDFYKNRPEKITSPVDLLSEGMQEVQLKTIAGGDLYCLSFRKPW